MIYGICMNLFILNTFKLYNFMDRFELRYYLYKICFHVKEILMSLRFEFTRLS